MTQTTNTRFSVTFEELVTAVIESQRTHYLTSLPKVLTNDNPFAQKVIEFLGQCAAQGFCPSLERLQEQIEFLPKHSELPLKVLFENWTSSVREDYVAQETLQFIQNNLDNNRPQHEGLIEFLNTTTAKTAINDTEVISYKNLPRHLYNVDAYRSTWGIPYFDEMTNNLEGGDFVVLLAPVKTGKTTLLKLACQAGYSQGETVMLCSQEQDPLKMSLQLDTQALGLSHSTARMGIDTPLMKKIQSVGTKARAATNDIIITPQVKSVAQLDELIRANGGKTIKKVFIDGLNLMGDYGDTYGSLAQVCSELKEYANKNDIIIVAVTQTNRTGLQAGSGVSASHVAGSYAILMYASVVIALSPLEESGRNFVYIHSVLNRHGGDETKVRMEMIYTKEGSFGVQFALLDPNWSPDVSNITFAARQELKANFSAEAGITFSDFESQVGEEAAEKMITAMANDTNVSLEGLI